MVEADKNPQGSSNGFKKKVWIAAAIVALFVVVLLILKAIFNVLLLVLAGILIAIFFRALSDLIQRNVHLPQWASLTVSILGTLALIVAFFWFAGYEIQQQINQLSKTLPQTIDNFKNRLSQNPIGQQIIERTSSAQSMQKASAVMQTFFRTTFGVLGDVYVILFIGIFFTVSPGIYAQGFLQLMPPKAKPKADDVLTKMSETLKKWLKGKLFAMLIVAVLTYVGLLIIGVPMALVLALLAGILNFIPNFGPLIALIPALLVGFTQGSTTALIIVGLYMGVQVLESNFITPQIQKKMVRVPPAMIIIMQLIMGVLTGGWGLVLATPILAILIVVIQELYIKKQEQS